MRKYWDDEMYDSDPFEKVGPIRVIAVKHNKTSDIWKSSTTIIYSEIFTLGFSCQKETNHMDRSRFFEEEWDTHDRSVIESILSDKENGIYEIVGDLYHHGWESGYYEREYDSEMDIREEKVQRITYDQARSFDENESLKEEEVYLTQLDKPKKQDDMYRFHDWNTEVHHYMEPHQIILHHANALSGIMNRNSMYGTRTSCSDMTTEELKNYIDMCMFELDSESEKSEQNKNVHALALRMDEEVQKTLEIHEEMFK